MNTSSATAEGEARRALAQRLRSLQWAGLEQLPKPSAELLATLAAITPTSAPAVASATASATRAAATQIAPSSPSSQENLMARKRAAAVPSPPIAAAPDPTPRSSESILSLPVLNNKQRAARLESLRQEVAGCTRCVELAASRTQTVFGVGPVQPRLCFFGEAPGADEDKQGIPFVGRAGQLLTDIIEKGMKLSRDDVYILNTLKCRPPGNRNPLPDEVSHCRRYFEQQLEILRPEFICCLGAVAAQNLLETTVPVGKLRGKIHDWRGLKVVVTYHPSYLLRNPAAKKYTWEDVQLLMEAMGSAAK